MLKKDLLKGKKSQYVLLEPLGNGGSAQIWKALDQSNDKIVSIKFYHKEVSDYLKNEGYILSLLKHESFVKIFDYILNDEYSALVMEYVEGFTLQQLFFEKNDILLIKENIFWIIYKVIEALDFLHSYELEKGESKVKGIYHRDLSPSNIMIDLRGNIKIIDFSTSHFSENLNGIKIFDGIGTKRYRDPALNSSKYSVENEFYSLGQILSDLFLLEVKNEAISSNYTISKLGLNEFEVSIVEKLSLGMIYKEKQVFRNAYNDLSNLEKKKPTLYGHIEKNFIVEQTVFNNDLEVNAESSLREVYQYQKGIYEKMNELVSRGSTGERFSYATSTFVRNLDSFEALIIIIKNDFLVYQRLIDAEKLPKSQEYLELMGLITNEKRDLLAVKNEILESTEKLMGIIFNKEKMNALDALAYYLNDLWKVRLSDIGLLFEIGEIIRLAGKGIPNLQNKLLIFFLSELRYSQKGEEKIGDFFNFLGFFSSERFLNKINNTKEFQACIYLNFYKFKFFDKRFQNVNLAEKTRVENYLKDNFPHWT